MTAVGTELGDAELIRASVRHVLDGNGPDTIRAALADAGWAELVDTDPATALTVLAEEAGRSRSPAPVAEAAVVWACGAPLGPAVAVVADGLAYGGAELAEHLLAIDAASVRSVERTAIELAPAGGFDPEFGLLAAVPPAAGGEQLGDATLASAALAAGRRALASQMCGAVEQMLADTIAYVTARRQYGRPIGSFQTVKHRLADVKVALAATQAGVRAAWELVGTEHEATAAIAAKCLAGRAQQLASTHCFQVHGGIAFTVEHGFQQWVRRGLLLDHWLGGHEQLTRQLGADLIARGAVPRVPDLT